MIGRLVPGLVAVAVVVAAAATVRPAVAQPASPARLLDVPYLPQSVALCGGAAAAMVMRYWGATGVYAETFSDLVRPDEGGIRGEELRAALDARGWDARAFRGDAPLVRRLLAERRPVIALIEDRPGTFHYVVIVGWPEGRVIAHDPASAPFQVYDEPRFSQAWERSGFFTLLALPSGPALAPATGEREPDPGSGPPCQAMVDEGVRLASAGDRDAAERVFLAAAAACPEASAPWRERAGLRVLGKDWSAAARLAGRAVSIDPGDAHAWRIAATGRYLSGDVDGALAAWNALDEPVLDIVNIRGLNRTRYAIVLDAAALEPQRVLTRASLARAKRRLAELPTAQASRVGYRPLDGGRAAVDATVIERPVLPTTLPAIAAIAVRAASQRELRASVASPSRGGEMWTGRWRWEPRRSALGIEFSAPGRPGLVRTVGVFSVEETFAGIDRVAERRVGGSIAIADWTGGGTRWEVSLGYERWTGDQGVGVVQAGVRQELDGDRLQLAASVSTRAGAWQTLAFGTGVDWRSTVGHEGVVALARAGLDTVGQQAPPSLWPGAGTGAARDTLLRAHPLLDDGVIARGAFGRTLVHGGAELRWWRTMKGGLVRVAPAAFVDLARAARTHAPYDRRLHADAGIGLRLALPGAGVVRVDVARGVRDGAVAWSVGWSR